MKNNIILFVTLISFFGITTSFSNNNNPDDLNVELYVMRKGSNVRVVLISTGDKIPSEIMIERKSSATLSQYGKIKSINGDELEQFIIDKKIIINDNYPESRQLDSYYRIRFIDKKGAIKTLPAVFLSRASNDNAITFGDHKQDETMFETEEEKTYITYSDYGIAFSVKVVATKVLITMAGGESLIGSWFFEKKSAKSTASFKRFKSISEEDKELTKKGEHVFLDKYPESRKLDVYYRLMVLLKDGKKIEFPSVLLPRTSNSKN